MMRHLYGLMENPPKTLGSYSNSLFSVFTPSPIVANNSTQTFGEALVENLPLPLYVISIGLHSLGLHVLIGLKGHRTNQDTIIMNISVTEILMSLFDLAQNVLSRFSPHMDMPIKYLIATQCTLFVVPNFLIMFVLTVDRFLEIYLNIKYWVYTTKKKTRITLLLCWLLGLTLAIIFIPLKATAGFDAITVIYQFVMLPLEFIVISTAFVAYSYIYVKLKRSRQAPSSIAADPRSRTKPRNFFAPLLILISFVVFVISPDVTNLILFYVLRIGNNFHANILLTFYVTGFMCDALIYIFLQRHVRKKLIRKFKQSRMNSIRLAVIERRSKNRVSCNSNKKNKVGDVASNQSGQESFSTTEVTTNRSE